MEKELVLRQAKKRAGFAESKVQCQLFYDNGTAKGLGTEMRNKRMTFGCKKTKENVDYVERVGNGKTHVETVQ